MDPNLRWCPDPDCELYVSNQKNKDQVKCQCGTLVCMDCGEVANPPHVCGQSDEDRQFELWKKGEGGKHCPKCGIVIIKNGGCNHMTCQKCKHEFCWHDFQNFRRPNVQHFETKRVLPCPGLMYGNVSEGTVRRRLKF